MAIIKRREELKKQTFTALEIFSCSKLKRGQVLIDSDDRYYIVIMDPDEGMCLLDCDSETIINSESFDMDYEFKLASSDIIVIHSNEAIEESL